MFLCCFMMVLIVMLRETVMQTQGGCSETATPLLPPKKEGISGDSPLQQLQLVAIQMLDWKS